MGHEIVKNRMIQWKTMNAEANKRLQQLDADFDATAEMGTLSVAQQQMVEIAKGNVHQCKDHHPGRAYCSADEIRIRETLYTC